MWSNIMNEQDERGLNTFTNSVLNILPQSKVVIYGAGYMGLAVLYEMRNFGVEPLCFIDVEKSKHSASLAGVSVISPDELSTLPKDVIAIISPSKMPFAIKKLLENNGVKNIIYYHKVHAVSAWYSNVYKNIDQNYKNNLLVDGKDKISNVRKALCDAKSIDIFDAAIDAWVNNTPEKLEKYNEGNQYFPNDIVMLGENEVFVDCGAYRGDTIQILMDTAKLHNGSISKIYAFEPDEINFLMMNALVASKNYQEITSIYKCCVGDGTNKEIRYKSQPGGGGHISDDGEKIMKLISIDDVVFDSGHTATYIKMDIEGAELNALKGAQKVIERDKPRMAISLYHRINDLWEIPSYLIEEYGDIYNFFIRQHNDFFETVLYAIPKDINSIGRGLL